MVIELLIVSVITIYIVDLSGIMESIKRGLWLWLKGDVPYKDYRLKPFDCSLCMVFWVGLFWLFIILRTFSLPLILWVCVLSWFADVIGQILRQIKDNIIVLLNKLYL
jgi:hypothetical protein